jgi:hypothetical protein
VCQPLLAASQQISRNERAGECLQTIGCCAFQEGIGELLKSDAVLAQAISQPMMLIEADTGREWKVGAHANEHSPPTPIVDVKIVLNDPALGDLKMPPVRGLVTNSNHDPRWLARFEDDDHCVWLGTFEVWIHEFVTPTIRRVHDRNIALGRSFRHPALKFVSDAAQSVPRHRVELAVRIEEPDHPLRLLERLNQSIQQNAIEAAIVPIYAVPVVLVKGVHDRPPLLCQGQDRSSYSGSSNMAPP